MPRPVLTRTRIAAVGVHIANEMGLGALTTQAVARRVGATAVGVQRLVGATELIELVVEDLVATMPAVPIAGSVQRTMRRWALSTREWAAQVPGLARHLLTYGADNSVLLDRVESVSTVLATGRITKRDGVLAARSLFRYVLSSAELDEMARLYGWAPANGAEATGSEATGSERWPLLSSVSVDSDSAAKEQFLFGLDLLLAGVNRLSHRQHTDAARTAGIYRPSQIAAAAIG